MEGIGLAPRCFGRKYMVAWRRQREIERRPKTPAVIYVDAQANVRLDLAPPERDDKDRYRGYYVISFSHGIEEVAYWTGYGWLRTGLEEASQSTDLDYVRGRALDVRTEVRAGPRGSRNRW